MRVLIAACGTLTLVVIDHYVFHRLFIISAILGVTVFGSLLFWRYLEEVEQRRRASARQQLSNEQEEDASGG